MLHGTLKLMMFVCDRCRAVEMGKEVPCGNSGRTTYSEPDGWEKRVVKRPSGTVVRHYCPLCQDDATNTTTGVPYLRLVRPDNSETNERIEHE